MEARLRLRVSPGAKKNSIPGAQAGRLAVKLAAPPVEGKANAALLAFLAREAGLKRRQVVLLSGEKSREKTVGFLESNAVTRRWIKEALESGVPTETGR